MEASVALVGGFGLIAADRGSGNAPRRWMRQYHKGKFSGIMGILNLLQTHFNKLEIDVHAYNGQMSEDDYEDKVKEAFSQLGIMVDD